MTQEKFKVIIQTTERHRYTTEVFLTEEEYKNLDDMTDEELFDIYVNRDTDFDDACDAEVIDIHKTTILK